VKKPGKIGRPTTLPEPLASMAARAGGVNQLVAMLGIGRTTLHTWGRNIGKGHLLDVQAQALIEKVQEAQNESKTT
jgi:hypothetical protein